ncbi:MAG TPA: hypothetical protein VMI54_22575 [Polyangiaceae bacterium]|nr:hypothetical protein [Polyangiaceae bacterium]
MRERIGSGRPWLRGVRAAVLLAVPLVGCGGARVAEAPAQVATRAAAPVPSAPAVVPASTPAPTPSDADAANAPADDATDDTKTVRTVPTACEPESSPCSTPAKFVEQVCRGKYPDLALAMFEKGTPWRRGYVKVETLEPVNMYDGERSENWLSFGEEVLVLRTRGPGAAARVQVSGPTDVDILRWDGTCATIRQEMLAPYPTNTSVLTARIVWKYLDTPTQEALLADHWVQSASEKERPLCHGSTMKHPDAPCDKASRKLTDAIAVAVRGGLVLPTPSKIPAWQD